jgi:hypothetical protein
MAEPVRFPAPADSDIADRIERLAATFQESNPHRSLLDCRRLAVQVVDVVISWDAEDVA